MEIQTQPQQLSFIFEETGSHQAVVSLNVAGPIVQDLAKDSSTSAAVVYDFKSAFTKRKESAHASLYRQILDTVRHIG